LKSVQPDLETKVENGELIDSDGRIIGRHRGYPFYTIGQRKGLGGGFSEPTYVIGIDADNNRVMVGNKHALKCKEFLVGEVNWLSAEELEKPVPAQIKIRYNDHGHNGILYPQKDHRLKVVFDEAQNAVTPGQSAVFFAGEQVLGGGIIEKRLNPETYSTATRLIKKS
jgi:tRNA-specific 2-thiouridylase